MRVSTLGTGSHRTAIGCLLSYACEETGSEGCRFDADYCKSKEFPKSENGRECKQSRKGNEKTLCLARFPLARCAIAIDTVAPEEKSDGYGNSSSPGHSHVFPLVGMEVVPFRVLAYVPYEPGWTQMTYQS